MQDQPDTPAQHSPPPRPRRPINGFAVLACMVLIVGTIIISMRLGSIDFYSPSAAAIPSPEAIAEHCLDAHRAHHAEPAYPSMDDAAHELGTLLELEGMVVFDLSELQLRFGGGDVVDLPGNHAAAHFRYHREDADTHVSIFVPDAAVIAALQPPQPSARWEWVTWQPADAAANDVVQGTRERQVIFITSDAPRLTEAVALYLSTRE